MVLGSVGEINLSNKMGAWKELAPTMTTSAKWLEGVNGSSLPAALCI